MIATRRDLQISNNKLKKIISECKLVDPDILNSAYNKAEEENKSLGDILVEQELISEEYLAKSIAEALKIQYVDLENTEISQDVLHLVNEETARNYRIIPFNKEGKIVDLAMENPNDFECIEFLPKI